MTQLLSVTLLLAALSKEITGQAQALRSPQLDVSHEVKLPQLTQQATLIVEGRPVSSRSFWNRAHTTIYTATTLEVYKVFKGELTGSAVEVITYGGSVGYTAMSSTANVHLDAYTVGVFFLRPSRQPSEGSPLAPDQVTEVLYDQQGIIRYSGDPVEKYAAISKFREYLDIEKTLYALLQQQVGKPYQTKKSFDVGRYDQVQERLTGVDAATTPVATPPTDAKKVKQQR